MDVESCRRLLSTGRHRIDRGLFYFVALQGWNEDQPQPFDDELETRLPSLNLKSEKRWAIPTCSVQARGQTRSEAPANDRASNPT